MADDSSITLDGATYTTATIWPGGFNPAAAVLATGEGPAPAAATPNLMPPRLEGITQ